MKNDNLVFAFNWLPRDFGNQEEKATFADLSITVSGLLASEVEDRLAKTVRDTFRTSAYQLAYWFAENWWRLRWEPERETNDWQMSHDLCSIGGGYIWPNISLFCDGEFISVKSTRSQPNKTEPIRFLADFLTIVPANSFFRDLDFFIAAIIERLTQRNLPNTKLHQLWAEVVAERSDPEATKWRKKEAILGLDPDSGPPEIIEGLNANGLTLGNDAVEEIAAAKTIETLATIDHIHQQVKASPYSIRIPDFSHLRLEVLQGIKMDSLPWEKGETVALIIRKNLGLGDAPVYNTKLGDIFSVPASIIDTSSDTVTAEMAAGYRVNQSTDQMNVFLNRRPKTSRRFALMRLIGDHLMFNNDDRLLPATDTKTARQKFQRAFAQEFLCPFESLNTFLENKPLTDDSFEEAAVYYDVSPLLVKTTLRNKGVLERDA